ncbi:MAG TPA: hypothetical protein VN823_03580 [Stellaceae bacterium]|nr:hypothetical protein [Stellaceae bacterium]
MAERTTVRLPDGLLERAKRKAAAEGRTLTALIEEGLRSVLAKPPEGRRPKPPLPRISRALGGLVPAVDLTSASSLQEEEDLDYIRRMKHLE